MNTTREKAFEALASVACAALAAALTAGYLIFCLTAGMKKSEPDPYSVCEFCGEVLTGTTNNVCVPEHAEGSSK